MRSGTLYYKEDSVFGDGRPDIRFDDGTTFGGLHCGDCVQLLLNDVWIWVRIEKAEDWLICIDVIKAPIPYGQPCRV